MGGERGGQRLQAEIGIGHQGRGEALRLIARERITGMSGVPVMARELINHPDFEKTDTSSLLALAVAAGLTGPALAQTAPAPAAESEAVDEVIVTGIRESEAESIDIKRRSKQIVDSIVAEDIGKFPDNNVVEALQRVTGVQVTNRASGEVAGVSIRGLGDITTTVNGRNIFTAAGTAVALQDIPASLLKQVDVYKTRSASLIETGIAGQIDIHTQRPFDFDTSKLVVMAWPRLSTSLESGDTKVCQAALYHCRL